MSRETRNMRHAALVAVPLALAALIAALGAGCGGGTTRVAPEPDPDPVANQDPGIVSTPPPGATHVDIALSEWNIYAEPAEVPAGEIYFLVDNIGGEPHEFVVIRSDLPPAQLPVVNGRVPEDEVDLIGEIAPFSAGSQASEVFDLAPGKYVLICNIAEQEDGKLESHYQEGMYAAFTVE